MSKWDTKFVKKGYTFDDVLLIPAESHVLPNEVDLSVQLAKNIKLNIPIISAGMDTVTESAMAIAMARQGGLGVIHKNMTIERQADEVRKVKRSESGVIIDPFFLTPDNKVFEAEALMHKYRISGVPIVENAENRKFCGIITNRDLRFVTDSKVKIDDVMTKENLITAPEGTSLEKAEEILQQYKIEKLPMVNEEGQLTGLITIKDIEKVVEFPHAAKDEHGRLLVAAAVGVTSDTFERAEALLNAGADALVIDTAHGHSAGVLRKIKEIREHFPEATLIAGNVATAEATKALYDAGVDVVKVGIGPGRVCITKIKTGFGTGGWQLSALNHCSKAARKPIIADGGIRTHGDIAKSIRFGASMVMVGSLFAAHEESPGETVELDGKMYKEYFGSASEFQKGEHKNVEGKKMFVEHKGSLFNTLTEMQQDLQSSISYAGGKDLNSLRKVDYVIVRNSIFNGDRDQNL